MSATQRVSRIMLVIDVVLFEGAVGPHHLGGSDGVDPVLGGGVVNGVAISGAIATTTAPMPRPTWCPGHSHRRRELHNNHHSFATSAKLSARWYEFDIGWMYIRILEILGLAKKVIPTPRFCEARKTLISKCCRRSSPTATT